MGSTLHFCTTRLNPSEFDVRLVDAKGPKDSRSLHLNTMLILHFSASEILYESPLRSVVWI